MAPDSSSTPYIVVTGTDFSEQATRALRSAYEQARAHAPAELHVVHASIAVGATIGPDGPLHGGPAIDPLQSLDEQQASLVRHLDEQLATLPGFAEAGVSVMAHVLLDAPVFALTQLASELGADLIVVGSHGRHGVARWLLGSVAEAVVRQAACPVLVIPPRANELPAREPRPGDGRRHVYHAP